ncbi:MAG: META domain-containing protein [Verrucomicrobiota bacterium]
MNLKNTVGAMGCFAAALLFVACQDKGSPDAAVVESATSPEAEVKTLYVGPTMADCVGVAPMTCLLVKDSPDAEYGMFYDPIEGFDYVPGYEYELRVEVAERENVPADASALVYSLVEVVGKKKAGLALEDGGWELKARAGIHIAFQGGKLSGHAGVNRYFGNYELDGAALAIGPAGSTQMAGPQEAMEQEQRFLKDLGRIAKYRIVGKELRLIDGEGQVALVFVPRKQLALSAVQWRATGVNNGKGGVVSVLAGTEITAKFEASGMLSGNGGCNNYSGSYELDGEKLRIGALGQTRKMCARPEGIMEQEANYFRALGYVANYRIDGKTLELRSEKGALLVQFAVKP